MQFIVISDQLISMAWALLLGAVLALCYDALRILRMLVFSDGVRVARPLTKVPAMIFSAKPVGTVLELITVNVFDVLFAAFAAAAFSIFTYHFNSGYFRWYIFLACVMGFALYRLSVGRLVMLCAGYAAGALRVALGFIVWLILRPAVLICRLAKACAVPVSACFRRLVGLKRTEKIRKRLPSEVRFR